MISERPFFISRFQRLLMKKEGEVRISSGCAISGIFCRDGRRITGEAIKKSIAVMHNRSNGLGGGFAGYGIYPQYKDYYALHVFYDSQTSREETERFLDRRFDIINLSKIPVRQTSAIADAPLIWRYFVSPLPHMLQDSQLDEDEYTSRAMIRINDSIDGAYVVSCGKDMGVFKAVGYPEDVADFYRIEEYEGYSWTAHGRYPTNTPGWWAGSHPFSLLDLTVVHNGEISSYDANRRAVEMYGYSCNLLTDTEVITYILDYLTRKQGLTLEECSHVIAAPFWSTIAATEDEDERNRLSYMRKMFSSFLITGPFSILVGFSGGMMALNDRLKLRSLVAAEKGSTVYFSSEEAAIRVIEDNPDRIWAPRGGEAVIVTLEKEAGR